MMLAVDVAYRGEQAWVGGVLFARWMDEQPCHQALVRLNDPPAYTPGQFYRRELPCILALLRALPRPPTLIIIDGYVYLGPERRDGLGRHLYRALGESTPVIGVAKTRFKDTPSEWAIYRGRSQRPLYVTAIGIDEALARPAIVSMHGRHRIPTLLKRVDQLCRQVQ